MGERLTEPAEPGQRQRTMKKTVALLLTVVFVAACGGADSGSDPSTPTTVADGSGQAEVVLSLTYEGGFVPVDVAVDQSPAYVLMSDGTLIFDGPIPEIFPGPMLPNTLAAMLDDDEFAEILRLVDSIGFADFDEKVGEQEPGMMVEDAGNAVFRFYDTNGVHTYSFPALGAGPGVGGDPLLLLEIVDLFGSFSSGENAVPFVGERLKVIAGGAIGMGELTTAADWPLDIAFADMDEIFAGMRCTVLEGDAVEAAVAVFDQANSEYRWGDEEVGIRARYLRPGEQGCQSAGVEDTATTQASGG